MQPRIIDLESTLKTFPKPKTAPRFRRHHLAGVILPHQRSRAIPLGQVPLAEVSRLVATVLHLVRNGAGIGRQGVVVVDHAVLRTRHPREHRRPRKRTKRMRRGGLTIIDPSACQRIEGGSRRVGISRPTPSLPPPLGSHHPQYRRSLGHDKFAPIRAAFESAACGPD